MATSPRSVSRDQTTAPTTATPITQHASQACMALLADGVPLSLLLDLAGLTRATSKELVRNERADTTWVPHRLSA